MKQLFAAALLTLTSCTWLTKINATVESGAQCNDDVDNDGDDLIDCLDSDCDSSDDCADTPPTAVDDLLTGVEDTQLTLSFDDLLLNDIDPDTPAADLQITDVTQSIGGAPLLNTDRTITFTPNANFNGAASFDYTIKDISGGTSAAIVTINIAPQNDAPVAVEDTDTAVTGVQKLISVGALLVNDSDVDGDSLTLISVQNSLNCTATLAGSDISFLAANAGIAAFEYTISDGNGLTASTKVTVAVTDPNDPPVAIDDVIVLNEDTQLLRADDDIEIVGNDVDPEGDVLTVVFVQNAINGTVSLNNGLITFTPDANFNGDASFTYTVTDGAGNFDDGLVTLTYNPVNDAPSASDNVTSTQEDTPANIDIAQILSDDTDIDGDIISLSSVQNAQNGSVIINGGVITFTPTPGFAGSASFEYTITDGALFDTAIVIVAVGAVGDPPVPSADSGATNEDINSVLSAASLLANDVDPDGDTLVLLSAQNPINGTVAFAGGVVTFTPSPNFFGVGSYEYTVTDGFFPVSSTVTITVNPVNDAPTADNVSNSTNEEVPLLLTLTGADIEGDALQFITQSNPSNGTLGSVTILNNTTSQITYTPNPNFNGTDSFQLVSFDGGLTSALATVTITVLPINDAPIANDDTATTNEDTITLLSSAALTSNDFDADNNPLSVISVGNAVNGTVSLNAGIITFIPAPEFSGDASFEYTVSDGTLTDVGAVVIVVDPVNDPPAAFDNSFGTSEDTPRDITNNELTGDDTDIDSGSLFVSQVQNALNGSASLNAGIVTFTPAANFSGVASFEYVVSDGAGGSDVGSVTMNIAAVADAPTLIANDFAGTHGTTIDVGLSAFLVDNDGSETLSVKIENIPGGSVLSAGTVTGGGSGTVGAPTSFTMGSGTFCVASGDFNTDGHPDIVTANSGSNNISVRLGDGLGGFGAATNFATGTGPRSVAVGQFNADTALDVVVANSGSSNASLLLGNGVGGFGAPFNFAAGATPSGVTVSDFNRDGAFDMAVSNATSNNVSVFLGTGGGSFSAATNFAIGAGAFSLTSKDVNRDGNPDIITANETSDNVSVLLGTGTGAFGAATNFAAGDGPRGVTVGDFNNDTNQDLATVNVNGVGATRLSVLLGNGAGSFGAPTGFTTGVAPSGITNADLNNDGNLDLVVANTNAHTMGILLGNGNGTFQTQISNAVGGTPSPLSVALADFNGDGALDVVTANNAGTVTVFKQNLGLLTVILTESDLASLAITPPAALIGDFVLTVTATATELSNGSVASVVDTFVMSLL